MPFKVTDFGTNRLRISD